jgi:acyl-ACP thioesterase
MYEYTFPVAFSDIDANWALTLPALLNAMQNCAIFQFINMGYDLNYLRSAPTGWVLLTWQLEMQYYPVLGESVCVRTWAFHFERIYGHRYFEIESRDHGVFGAAKSQWVFFNQQKKRPQKIPPEMIEAFGVNPRKPVLGDTEAILLPPDMETHSSFSIKAQDLDTNRHTNNARFIQMCLEYLPQNPVITKFQAQYKHAARLHDVITPKVYHNGNRYYVLLENPEAGPHVCARFDLQNSADSEVSTPITG